MNKWYLILTSMFVFSLLACGQDSGQAQHSGLPIPPKGFVANLEQGKTLFAKNCALCHGQTALGTNQGPPLIHKVYRPDHHADLAFYMAVKNGTQQHHWQFGNMPPIKGVTPEDAGHIVAYVRSLQRQAGL